MGKLERLKLYEEEFKDLFNDKKSFRVRGAMVISAFIEGQILLLAKDFLEKHEVKYDPQSYQAFRQSLNILKTNNVLDAPTLRDIEDFWTERCKSIHGPFKGMARDQWQEQNNKVVELGRPIIKNLDKKLYPQTDTL
jgi:hypothetical protein